MSGIRIGIGMRASECAESESEWGMPEFESESGMRIRNEESGIRNFGNTPTRSVSDQPRTTGDLCSVDMELDQRACDRARRSRDARFDGRFFIAVTTTRIYCRPICPA